MHSTSKPVEKGFSDDDPAFQAAIEIIRTSVKDCWDVQLEANEF
jgi:hypothetical protein